MLSEKPKWKSLWRYGKIQSEIHGLGQNECGMILFIETDSKEFWFNQINSRIMELFSEQSSMKLE